MGDVAIRAEGLTKEYRTGFWRRRVRVLHDLNLEVEVGQVFGFLGPNGAGKTTTLKLLTGLIYPTAGSATVLGEPAGSVGVKARVGFLPENPYFYDYLTGAEYLDYCGALAGLSRGVRRDRVGAYLERVGLLGQGTLQLRKYSKGMLQRIGLAQALINEPAVIFLDEPMSGLDPIGRKEVRDLILQLREQGRTVFFSTHIIPDVEVVCDRVAIILAGRLAAVGRVEELLASPLEQFEITASDLPPEVVATLAARSVVPSVRSGDKTLLSVKGEEDLGQILRAILQAGGRVHSVVPHRRTLEEVFLASVGEGNR
ncbi:MAG TPA: ABC transporter ATP-binding protein [Candidatus Methylomirabilis sp.]|nr:ABC transporter ATP-binding protein [Candidatus Methylomirabilis sp.]HSB81047.1 ABC transporter ATP-binding protein [Candidatus Methylomirabilis sp.]